MFKIDNSTAVPTLPTPAAPGTPGYFSDGSPGSGVPATILPADWLNQVQDELMNVLAGASIAPDKTARNQLLLAIKSLSQGHLIKPPTIITASSTFTFDPRTTAWRVRGCGGGGAGGNSSTTGAGQASVSSGGMSGAAGEFYFTGTPPATAACVIGAGGTVSVALGASGGNGGATTFGSMLTLPGGTGGAGCNALSPPFITNNPGVVSLPTTTGTAVWQTGTSNPGSNGYALGSAANQVVVGAASCAFGFPNSGYGGGGSGKATSASLTGNVGLAGNNGFLIIEEYA